MGEESQTFDKENRVLKRGEFREIYETGRKIQARFFTAFVRGRADEEKRLGITSTRKIGNSVVRNRTRRLLREVFRKNKYRVPSGIDIVLNVKSALLEATYQDLEGDFIAFLERAGRS